MFIFIRKIKLKIFIFIYIKIIWKQITEEIKIFHLLVHLPNGYNSPSQPNLKWEARKLFQILHMGVGSQELWPSSAACPRPQAGSWMGTEAAGTPTGIHIGPQHLQGRFSSWATAAGPVLIFETLSQLFLHKKQIEH